MRRALLAILPLVLAAAPVAAQDDEFPDEVPGQSETTEKAEPDIESAPAATEPAAEPVAAPKAADKGTAEFPRISDDEETIYTVQRKAYLIRQKIELTPLGLASFTDRFVQTFGVGASVAYHIKENFGLELMGAAMFPDESGLTTEILREGKLTPEIAKLTQMLWAAGLSAQWSPIYGKIEIFDTTLGNFGFYVSAGLGVGQTRVQCTQGRPLDAQVFGQGANCDDADATEDPDIGYAVAYEPNRTQVMGVLAGGVRFYFSNIVGIRIEVRDWIFPARVFRPDTQEQTQRFTDAVRNNLMVQIGASFLFGGEDN